VHIVRELHDAAELRAAGIVHFNHHLRPAADSDERFCRELASCFGWPIVVGAEDVRLRVQSERRSLEDAARTARHQFFERAREELSADVVALGHTRDDQAETFLLRLIRGAGVRGLAGMHPRRGVIIRPLLDCRRAELRQYLDSRNIPFVHDESNNDTGIPRNRVRAELLPLLETRFNPSIVDVLADEAEIAREEWRWMDAQAGVLAEQVTRRDTEEYRLDAGALAEAPTALAHVVLLRAMSTISGGRAVAFRHVKAALDLTRGDGAPFDAPGQRVQRLGGELVLTRRPARALAEPLRVDRCFRYPLSIPGEVLGPNAGWAVSAVEAESAEAAGLGLSGSTVAVVRRERCSATLAVRNRRPGDRFRPLGLGGRKKLQDFFVDHKIARVRRDTVPLVVDESDRIVWVAGHTIDEEFRVTDSAQPVLILRLKVLGGSA
jgi:tRNA(Ile)-lysidine synthase